MSQSPPAPLSDDTTTIADLRKKLSTFTSERNWERHHTPAAFARTICIEAAELLEHFQWDGYSTSSKEDWADELADVINNALFFANAAGIDVAAAIERKLEKISKKYPVSLFNPERDSADDYWTIKKKYRENKE